MFFEKLNDLSPEDVRRLTAAGIAAPRISEWKRGKRLPTRTQTLVFCTVMDLNFDKVNREITEVEAKKDAEGNSLIAGVLKTLSPAWHFS